jgi:hypothetical protein
MSLAASLNDKRCSDRELIDILQFAGQRGLA